VKKEVAGEEGATPLFLIENTSDQRYKREGSGPALKNTSNKDQIYEKKGKGKKKYLQREKGTQVKARGGAKCSKCHA